MTAVSTIAYSSNAPMPGLKKGYCTAQNAYTTTFGFGSLKGAVVCVGASSSYFANVAVSSGSGTIYIYDVDGAAISADTTINFIAWGEK